jgi:nucleotide-binding universal stress UspA family protein
MQPVIVGVDRSETARRAAQAAAEMAVALGAPLHLVSSVSRTRSMDMNVGGSDHWHDDWLTSANQFLAAMAGELPAPTVEHSVSDKDPATALCEEAARLDARMIVVGNRRVQGVSRVLGSIASDVLKRAPCDVLIVNTMGDR